MEHRLSRRVDCDIEVLIVRRAIPAAFGRIRNISRYGMFITTDYQQAGLWQPMEIELLTPLLGNSPRRLRMSSGNSCAGISLRIDCPGK